MIDNPMIDNPMAADPMAVDPATDPGPFSLAGRVALVTGGNGGIGLGMARGLARAGARLVIAGRDDAKNADAVAALCAAPFRLQDLDRMAARLAGPPVPGGEISSEACPVGTVQVPPGGAPLILLNDKGTLGGYRRPARVHPDDLPLLVQAPPGSAVVFEAGS